MRARLHDLGVTGAVQASGQEVVATLPSSASGVVSGLGVGSSGQLRFYDWEPNVIGPSGRPAPTETTVTGGTEAGAASFGLSEYDAVLRAASRPATLRSGETSYTMGCTPQQKNDCLYGDWYLIDTAHHRMLCSGGLKTCPPLETEKALETGYAPPADSSPQAVRVNPGTILVQARPTEAEDGEIVDQSPASWYVLNDDPVLTAADITHPHQGFDEGAGGNGQPNVSFGFTLHGRIAFDEVTKQIAHRGQEAQLPGVSKEGAMQHFAVVLDGQLITVPSIDYTHYPEGIDAANGSEISGGLTVASARELAAELDAGELPVRLALISQSR